MKILVIGDSFAADWTVKYPGFGWPNLLAEKFEVTNLAQAGVSEYKIYQQILAVPDVHIYDLIIVSHTSPYRIHTRQHPIHSKDLLHKNADLIYTDIEHHSKTIKGFFNRSLKAAIGFFVHHYDENYQETVYMLLRNHINQIIGNTNYIVINNLPTDKRFFQEKIVINIRDIQQKYPGLMNHLSDKGNQLVYQKVLQEITFLNNKENHGK
jgi:lysophospholipase L1-like esterase